jgi:hypothetical protein
MSDSEWDGEPRTDTRTNILWEVTLRDQMAMAALMGPLAELCGTAEDHAQAAYEYADAMLEARKK